MLTNKSHNHQEYQPYCKHPQNQHKYVHTCYGTYFIPNSHDLQGTICVHIPYWRGTRSNIYISVPTWYPIQHIYILIGVVHQHIHIRTGVVPNPTYTYPYRHGTRFNIYIFVLMWYPIQHIHIRTAVVPDPAYRYPYRRDT